MADNQKLLCEGLDPTYIKFLVQWYVGFRVQHNPAVRKFIDVVPDVNGKEVQVQRVEVFLEAQIFRLSN